MSRFTISAIFASALLAFAGLHPAKAVAETSTTKKKSTSATTSKKKAATDEDESGTASSKEKKAAASSLELPLPAKALGAGTAGEKTSAAGDKASGPAEKHGDSKGRKGVAEKESSTAEKKSAENDPSTKPSDKAADLTPKREQAPNATVEPDTIAEFAAQPPRIQQLIRDAIDLTRLNLTYTFGSADPDNGGMDCSGTIYYLLRAHGFNDVARDSSGQYLWARKNGAFFPVISKSAESVEFNDLLPGDLMFWTGTYDTGRDVPISHVMLYLGREKGTAKRIMFGASDGRSYNGLQRWGVSVFDFKMPKPDPANPEKAKVDFVGFARIPGLRGASTTAAAATEVPVEPAVSAAAKSPTKSAEPAKPSTKSTPATSRKKKSASGKAD
jgi:cell wall-associated NlpC family hydrolase